MAKRKTKVTAKLKTKYSKKLMTAAGIFAAGSLVGAAVDFSSIPAYFEITAPSSANVSAGTETSAAEKTVQTLSAETEPTYTPPETKKEEVSAPVPETTAEVLPEVTPEPAPSPEPEVLPDSAPEPETIPESTTETEPEQESDWMEAIFVPSEEPSAGSVAEPDDWMDTEWETPVTEQTQTPAASSETSSMTEELAGMLENVAVFWAPSGGKIHLDPACRSFGTVCFTGTLEEAQTVRTEGWCRWCAEHLDGTDNLVFYVKGNVCATSEQLLRSYTYSDYLNGIPASAFGG